MSDSQLIGRAVLGKNNLRRRRVYVEEFGGDVLIQQLTAHQVAATQVIAQEAVDAAGTIKDRWKLSRMGFALIRYSWISEEGEHILSDDDYEEMNRQPHTAIETILEAIRDFNALDPGATRTAKKNSGPILNGVSGIN